MTSGSETREWASFEDPDEDRTWMIDVTFLESSWGCIFGKGCQGVLDARAPELMQGCCSYGAHFTDEADVERVVAASKTLTSSVWQFHAKACRTGVVRRSHGEVTTRMVDGACIFLNRPGFPAGPGCALHMAAVENGLAPMELKPDVCWQLPLRQEDHSDEAGHVISVVTEWGRRDWGEAGEEFAWWCTEAPEAFRASVPVYESLHGELEAMIGGEVFSRVRTYLDSRSPRAVPLPHPALRRREGS